MDDEGRPRKLWHKDVVHGKKTNLYKICKETQYDANNLHPGCKNIQRNYERKENKLKDHQKMAPGLAKKYANCTTYGTPYPQYVPIPGLEDLEEELMAMGSIQINNDAVFTESQNVTLTLSPSTTPDQMRFSHNDEDWTDWTMFNGTADFLHPYHGQGEKTVYVQYQTGETISDSEFDKILLLPKYNAEYRDLTPARVEPYETGRTYKFRPKGRKC